MTTRGRRPVDAAIVYARRGWAVFPCHHPVRSPGRCSCGLPECGSPGKHPRVAGGLHAATLDEVQIRAWWGRWPHANVAIRTGGESGIVVVDVDPDHGGEASLCRVVEESGPLPEGRTVRTGSGGQHLYFRHPGITVRNDAGRALGPGVDIRGDGGYVMAPPSRHCSGRPYVLEGRGGQLPELPEWILTRLQPPPRPTISRAADAVDAPAWGRAAVRGEIERLRAAREGARNDTLNRVAFRLGQIVGAGHLQEADIEPLLIENGIAIGLREREVIRTVRSGLQAGEGTPRGPTIDPEVTQGG